MDFRRPQTSTYGKTQHSESWQKRADERAQERQDKRDGIDRNDPSTMIQLLTARIAALEAWQSSFRITGTYMSGTGSVWMMRDPQITMTGAGTVTCDAETGEASIALDMNATLS